jgi:hypothetical protein
MTLLEGWEDQTIFIVRGPDTDGTEHFLTVQIDPKLGRTGIETYGETQAEATLKTLENVDLLKKGVLALPGGTTAYELVFKWTPLEDQVIFRRLLYVERRKNAFVIGGNFSEQSLASLGPQMDTMAATIMMYGD